MQRLASPIAARLLAVGALAAGAATTAPAIAVPDLFPLFESLMVLRDGHGAWHPRPTEASRSHP